MLVPCEECGHPILAVRGNVVVVKVKHHGDWHTSVVPLARLLALATQQALDNALPTVDNRLDNRVISR